MNMLIWIGYIGDIITIWNITKKWIYHNYNQLYGSYHYMENILWPIYWWYNSIWVTPKKLDASTAHPMAASDPIHRWPRWSSRATSPGLWHGPEKCEKFFTRLDFWAEKWAETVGRSWKILEILVLDFCFFRFESDVSGWKALMYET